MPERPESPTLDPRPKSPREPEPAECCQSGCDPCVFDRYWEAVERYERAFASGICARNAAPSRAVAMILECKV